MSRDFSAKPHYAVCARARPNFLNRINLIWTVQSHLQKHFRSSPKQITSLVAPSRPNEGRLAIVTNAGRDAVDAKAALTNGADADGEVVWF
jgi:hypothetical protein